MQGDVLTKGGLGRGLSSLISENAGGYEGTKQKSSRDTLPTRDLSPASWQPRQQFTETELAELTESIRQNGVLQPIIVRKRGNGAAVPYEIIAGERRWRAATKLGLREVPAIVMEVDDKKALEIALIENIQRQNLTPLEEAEGYQRLIKEFSYTQDNLSQVLGKSRSQLSNSIRLLSLPEKVKPYVESGELSAGHARALLAIDAEKAEAAAAEIVKKKLSVRQAEKLVKKLSELPRVRKTASDKPQEVVQIEKLLTEALGMSVAIDPKGESGKLTVQYSDMEGFNQLVRKLQA